MTYRVILTEADGEARTVATSPRLDGARMFYGAVMLHTGQRLTLTDPEGEAIATRLHGEAVRLPADHQA